MRLALTVFTVLALSVIGLVQPSGFAKADLFSSFQRQTAPNTFADLAQRLLPAVVNISSTQKFEDREDSPMRDMPQFPPGSPFEDFFEDFLDGPRGHGMPSQPPSSLGSGFIINAEQGYIVTNNHVVRDAQEVLITFHDDETVEAEVIGRDEKTDLAVLKVITDKKLVDVNFGNSDDMRVGDWVLAIGNPFGLGGTVTAGIVSARQRDINAGPYDDFIQTDASINRGNSGGPMFNLKGEVIGVNTAIFSPSGGSVGIGFAIPSSLASNVIEQIVEFGRTRRGWLGVRIQTVTDEIAESLGLGDARGALVAGVTEDGPAEKAGMKAGDIILEFNGKSVDEMRHLPRIVAETKIGSAAKVTLWRDNRRQKITVEVGELEKAEEEGLIEAQNENPVSKKTPKGTMIDEAGLTLLALTDALRDKYGIEREVNGVLVTEVERSADAARKGVVIGDVIVEVNQKPIETPEQFEKIIVGALDNNRGSVLLLLNQDGNVRFTGIKLKDAE